MELITQTLDNNPRLGQIVRGTLRTGITAVESANIPEILGTGLVLGGTYAGTRMEALVRERLRTSPFGRTTKVQRYTTPARHNPDTVHFQRKAPITYKLKGRAFKKAVKDCCLTLGETKFKNTTLSAAPGTSAALTLLNGLVQGTDTSNRIGNRIANVYLRLYGRVTIAAAGTSDCTRLMVVLDRATDGASPSISDILQNGSDASSQLNFDRVGFGKRYFVLMDKMIVTSISGTQTQCFVENIKLRTMTQYTGTTGAVSDILRGSIYFIQLGTDNVNKASSVAYAQLLYKDM